MDDTEHRDLPDDAYDPANEPKSSKPWLTMIVDAQKAGQDDYNDRCDNIDKRYSDFERLANTTRDREFQIFWANIQVLGPSVYSRPPVPVVTPRFKSQRELPRVTSEFLERATNVSFEMEDIDGLMRLIRDDLIINARGVARLRYEASNKDNNFTERVCIDHVHRRDFLSDPARSWKETDWVGFRAWMTKKEMRKRFYKTSGNAYQDAEFAVRKDEEGPDDGKQKAGVWEMWSKSLNKVCWVTPGVEKLLDDATPHINVEGFFPCPKPAYATVQRGSLIPVPDYVYYKDQIEEINELTARISSLTDSVQVRAFYPAGAGEIGDAIESAMKRTDDRQVLIGVSNWAMLGSGSAKDMLVWLPTEMVTDTIAKLVELRRQLIDDVYQITGLSDIMRGSTVASETLGAQELKSQYGSIRIRDKQDELVRFARDITRLAGEIMAEEFQQQTLLDMTQMEIPTDAEIEEQKAPLEAQIEKLTADVKEASQDPEVQAMAKENPEQAQQIVQQYQQQGQQLHQQITDLSETVTIEQVMKFLRDERMRPFVLDIETDSTIAPDENAQKQRATEFITAVGGFMQQAMGAVQADSRSAPVATEMLKYVSSQFRAGRELQGVIEEYADMVAQQAEQPQPEQPNPEVLKAQADAAKQQQEGQIEQAQMQIKLEEEQSKRADEEQARQIKAQEAKAANDLDNQEAQSKQVLADIQERQANNKLLAEEQKHAQDLELGSLQIQKINAEIAKINTVPSEAA